MFILHIYTARKIFLLHPAHVSTGARGTKEPPLSAGSSDLGLRTGLLREAAAHAAEPVTLGKNGMKPLDPSSRLLQKIVDAHGPAGLNHSKYLATSAACS